jgi:hypothetical protein
MAGRGPPTCPLSATSRAPRVIFAVVVAFRAGAGASCRLSQSRPAGREPRVRPSRHPPPTGHCTGSGRQSARVLCREREGGGGGQFVVKRASHLGNGVPTIGGVVPRSPLTARRCRRPRRENVHLVESCCTPASSSMTRMCLVRLGNHVHVFVPLQTER